MAFAQLDEQGRQPNPCMVSLGSDAKPRTLELMPRTPPAPRRATVCLPLSTVRNRRISHEALGLLLVASSYPSDTPFGEAWFRDLLGISRDLLRRQLRELEQQGYLERGRKRGPGGVLGSAEWRFRPFALKPAAAIKDAISVRGENPVVAATLTTLNGATKDAISVAGGGSATKDAISVAGATKDAISVRGENPVVARAQTTDAISVCSELNSSTTDAISVLGEPGTSIYSSSRFISKAVSSSSFSEPRIKPTPPSLREGTPPSNPADSEPTPQAEQPTPDERPSQPEQPPATGKRTRKPKAAPAAPQGASKAPNPPLTGIWASGPKQPPSSASEAPVSQPDQSAQSTSPCPSAVCHDRDPGADQAPAGSAEDQGGCSAAAGALIFASEAASSPGKAVEATVVGDSSTTVFEGIPEFTGGFNPVDLAMFFKRPLPPEPTPTGAPVPSMAAAPSEALPGAEALPEFVTPEVLELLEAWWRLRSRRHRTGASKTITPRSLKALAAAHAAGVLVQFCELAAESGWISLGFSGFPKMIADLRTEQSKIEQATAGHPGSCRVESRDPISGRYYTSTELAVKEAKRDYEAYHRCSATKTSPMRWEGLASASPE